MRSPVGDCERLIDDIKGLHSVLERVESDRDVCRLPDLDGDDAEAKGAACDECSKQSTLLEESKRGGSSGGNCLKGWMLAVPRCSGGLSSEHFWIDGHRLRAATKAPQRKRPCRSRALLVDPSSLASER
jgi:hypothetical protein